MIEFNDDYFMREAYKMAQLAYEEDEVPVGAVLVWNNNIIARAYNQSEKLNDFTAHAEMLVFSAAGEQLGHKYLNECTLYVTMEPCVMCAGAAFWTRVGKVVYGAKDEKRGALRHELGLFHPKTEIVGGVMETQCSEIVKAFFKEKRQR